MRVLVIMACGKAEILGGTSSVANSVMPYDPNQLKDW